MNACTAIVGINWGDEGKGRMVDLLTEAFDVVIRYQGGANAGHTVINQFGEFEIHALPSGVFRKGDAVLLSRCFWSAVQGIMEEMALDKDMKAPDPAWLVGMLKA